MLLLLVACDSGPKVIESEPAANSAGAASPGFPGVQAPVSEDHKVVVEEALNTEKYTYLRVQENGESFWIAIPKTPVEIGATYYYQGGLLKKNFASKEYNRVFETITPSPAFQASHPAAAAPPLTRHCHRHSIPQPSNHPGIFNLRQVR